MSENKDFELLKHKVQFIESCEMTCEIGCHEAFKNIYEAASRMAAEIADLKAELAKRPEIIRCGECRNRNRLFKCPISEANALIKQLEKVPSKTYFIELTDNDYCSAGVRRESEENNEI